MSEIVSNTHYPIHLDNSLNSLSQFLEYNRDRFGKYFILVDEHTHTECVPLLLSKVKSLQEADILEIDAGEEHKNLRTATGLWEAMLENNVNRKNLLINLGGGVLTDMGGFVASVFKRGIPFIHIPTSLLAQVDAAVGSKTGVDLGNAKNQVGTFAHPDAVFICTDFLQNLPERELYSGLGEILKYALIASPKLWDILSTQQLSTEMDFDFMVGECVQIKNELVQRDWYEKGERKLLNFGHTVGHAIESLSLKNPQRSLRHGEAVAMGIIVEMYISSKVFGLDEAKREQVQQYILENFDLYPIEEGDFEALIDLMMKDKKNTSSAISFVLLEDIGKAHYNQDVDITLITESLNYYAGL